MESGNKRIVSMPRKRPKFLRRKTTGDVIFDVFNLLFLILFSLSILYPFWTTFLLSFSKIDEAKSLGFHLWIKNWSFNAYKFAFSKYGNVGTAYTLTLFLGPLSAQYWR